METNDRRTASPGFYPRHRAHQDDELRRAAGVSRGPPPASTTVNVAPPATPRVAPLATTSIGGRPWIGLGVEPRVKRPTLGPRIGLGVEPKARRGRQGYVEKPVEKVYVTFEVLSYLRSKRQHGEQAIDDTLRRLLGMKKRTPE